MKKNAILKLRFSRTLASGSLALKWKKAPSAGELMNLSKTPAKLTFACFARLLLKTAGSPWNRRFQGIFGSFSPFFVKNARKPWIQGFAGRRSFVLAVFCPKRLEVPEHGDFVRFSCFWPETKNWAFLLAGMSLETASNWGWTFMIFCPAWRLQSVRFGVLKSADFRSENGDFKIPAFAVTRINKSVW